MLHGCTLLHWILIVAGILFLYFGFWLIFTKLISYLSRRIERKIALYTISSALWLIAVYIFTGMNVLMTIVMTVIQVGIVLPYAIRKISKKATG